VPHGPGTGFESDLTTAKPCWIADLKQRIHANRAG
jgi:hypothetical protein